MLAVRPGPAQARAPTAAGTPRAADRGRATCRLPPTLVELARPGRALVGAERPRRASAAARAALAELCSMRRPALELVAQLALGLAAAPSRRLLADEERDLVDVAAARPPWPAAGGRSAAGRARP